ncbi:MAG: DMT family transporter [Rhizobiaceae bacterium]|nr:DMT family transporter [Rhizobiaceae bacterium]
MQNVSPVVLAALIMGIGIAGIPLGDTAGKLMFQYMQVEPVFIAWSRYGLGIFLVWLAYFGRGFDYSVMKDWRLWLRSGFVVASIILILSSIRTEPLANTFAAFFVGPIFAYFGSAILLREKITWFRTVTLLCAFCGVLIVVRPGFGMSAGLGFALLGGMFYAAFLVSTRWLSTAGGPRTLLLSNLIMGTLLLTPWGIASVPAMDFTMATLVLWSAAASAVGNLAIVLSSSLVDGSRIAPLIYMQVVYATLYGILFFGELPDKWTWIGLIILVSSGFASFFAQRR